MKRTQTLLAALMFLFLSGTGVWGQKFLEDGYIESAGIRETVLESWLTREIDPVRALPEEEYKDRYGTAFSVYQETDAENGLLAVTVVPVGGALSGGKWILYRRLSDGMPDSIRIYPLKDPSIYISLRSDGDNPEKGKTLLDMSIYSGLVCRDLPIGAPLVRLYTATLASIIAMSPKLVPWYLLSPDAGLYSGVTSAAASIRNQLGTLVYFEDGAFNENDEPVLILTGAPQDKQALLASLAPGQDPKNIVGGVNCSGFAKWIVDGIIKPRSGSSLYINPLKAKTASPETHFTDPYRESRDLFFALDWTRNLASAVVSQTAKKTVRPGASGVDVTLEPFAGSLVHELNVGYRARELRPLLYYLAVNEPGHFYLGAVSRERGRPLLRQYHHIIAFFPYFDGEGTFQVAIFESAVETPFASFLAANQDSYIHLVRLRLPEEGYFQP